ncbi:MAG: hypothetical protein ACI923_000574 [Flavobacteriales bacterium]|jgi:hypothetical protein
MKKFIAIFCLSFCTFSGHAQYVLLNEYSKAEGAEAEGWIELYNPTEEAYLLENWRLRFLEEGVVLSLDPILIEAGGYEVIGIDDGMFGFKKPTPAYINQQTSNLELVNADDAVISSLYWVCIPDGMSFGRGDSFPSQVHFYNPTPGSENASDQYVFQEKAIHISPASGFYNQSELELFNSTDPSVRVNYTFSGIAPKAASSEWPSEGLMLNSANSTQTELSYIAASDQYIDPLGDQETAHTIALQAFVFGCPVSPIDRRVYFIGNSAFRDLDVPIVSISTSDESLFGEEGIYGNGITGENFAYRGRLWEREATLAYFDEGKSLKLEQNMGLRIRGNSSRYSPQKSFKLFGRKEYDEDDDFENLFFPSEAVEEFERLNLRTPHTDFISSMMTDHFAMNLVEDLNVDAPSSKTCLLFLNGEFWGVYSLQESMDDHYPESHYDINDDDVILFDDEIPEYYQSILDFARGNDLTLNANYDWIEERVDLASLIDYHCVQLFFANWDWPIKNVKAWFSEESSAPLRYYFFDCDACFNEFQQESMEQFYPGLAEEDYRILFSKLMQNEGFRTQFTTRMVGLLGSDFALDNLLEKLDLTLEKMAPLVDYQIARWGFPQSRNAWEQSVESIRLFLLSRHFEIIEQLKEINADQLTVFPNPSVTNSTIQIDSFGYLSGKFNFLIHDHLGRSVQWGTSEAERIDLDDLPAGMYILRLEKNGFLATTRFSIAY